MSKELRTRRQEKAQKKIMEAYRQLEEVLAHNGLSAGLDQATFYNLMDEVQDTQVDLIEQHGFVFDKTEDEL